MEKPSKPQIWLVDDSPLEIEIARGALSDQYEFETFNDGSVVLERLAEGFRPDVLVLDWMMPGISGIEVCRFIRNDTGSKLGTELAILLLTAQRDTEHIVEGLNSGANDFLSKPFIAAELVARVSALIRSKVWRERAERAERDRLADAEERVRLNDLFVGIIGHDFRDPLNAIATASALIARADYPADKKIALAGRVAHSTRRMTVMIEQLLDVTRTRLGGGIGIEPRSVDLADLCRQVVEELRLAYPEREIILAAIEADTRGVWDPYRLAQAFSNIIANAAQHGTRTTPIAVSVDRVAGELVVSVHNEGAGIPPHIAATLFDPFLRGGQPSQHRTGLGLGLYITQQIVQAHGGRIVIDNESGVTFRICLPPEHLSAR